MVLGLAPAAHGGNRTGRVFTGDASATFLIRALYEAGLANQPLSDHRDDGLVYSGAYVCAAVRCVPPQDRPTLEEQRSCLPYLSREMRLLPNLKVVFALGQIAFQAALRAMADLAGERLRAKFNHGEVYHLKPGLPLVVACYHPSPRNTNTGRLSMEQLVDTLKKARRLAVGELEGGLVGRREIGFVANRYRICGNKRRYYHTPAGYSAVSSPESAAARSISIPPVTIVPNARALPAMSLARSSSQSSRIVVSSFSLSSAATIRPSGATVPKRNCRYASRWAVPWASITSDGLTPQALSTSSRETLNSSTSAAVGSGPMRSGLQHHFAAARRAAPVLRLNQPDFARHVLQVLPQAFNRRIGAVNRNA